MPARRASSVAFGRYGLPKRMTRIAPMGSARDPARRAEPYPFLEAAGLGGADVKILVNLTRVGTDNGDRQDLGQPHGQRRFPSGRGPADDDELTAGQTVARAHPTRGARSWSGHAHRARATSSVRARGTMPASRPPTKSGSSPALTAALHATVEARPLVPRRRTRQPIAGQRIQRLSQTALSVKSLVRHWDAAD